MFTGGFVGGRERASADGGTGAAFHYFVVEARGGVEFGGDHYRVMNPGEWVIALLVSPYWPVESAEVKGFVTRFTVEKPQALQLITTLKW